MKTLLNLKKDVAEQAKRFELKGRSKIETTDQLLKAMKEQGFEEERKVLMSINRRLKNLHNRTQKQINSLDYPVSPLKGHGYQRSEYFSTDLLEHFNIPESHVDEISNRRQKGFFSWSSVISLELDKIFSEYERKFNAIAKEFYLIKTPADIKAEKLKKEQKEREDKKRAEKEKHFKKLGGIDAIFTEFFNHESHPAPQTVLDAKYASGKSWNHLRDIYKR